MEDNKKGSKVTMRRQQRHVSPQRSINLADAQRSQRFSSSGSTSFSSSSSNMQPLHHDQLLIEKIELVQSSINGIQTELAKKIDAALSEISMRLNGMLKTITSLENRCTSLEEENENLRRINRLNDVVIRGVPQLPDENPREVVKQICSLIQLEPSPFMMAFRAKTTGATTIMKNNNNSNNNHNRPMAPIIVRFSCINEKKMFFSRFRQRKGVKLCELDQFSSESKIFVNDSLTLKHQRILRHALKLFKQNKIASTYTVNGLVYVKSKNGTSGVRVDNLNQLNALVDDNCSN